MKVVGGAVSDGVGASADTVAALADMGVEDPDQLGEDKGVPMMMEQTSEKRIRREIANSNERRRMQSINAGFSSLRSLLPHHEGEKLSKAAILQQTAEYIYSLEQEKTRLLSQNCQLKRLLGQQNQLESDETDSGPAPKRRLIDTGQKLLFEEENDEITELQSKYERERRTRMLLEDKIRVLENSGARVYEDRVEILEGVDATGQTILSSGGAALKKVGGGGAGGMETIILQTSAGDRLPSIIQVKDGSKVEVEHLPRLTEFGGAEGETALEIASVQDPETGATRQFILTTGMGNDSGTSKQNLETIVEAIRHLEGDHLFSEESGPHQVVKEEVVESTISLNEDSTMVEMTLPSLTTNLPCITSLPQIPVSSLVSLPNIPVTFNLASPTVTSATSKSVTNTIPLLPQVPVSMSQLTGVTSIQQLDLRNLQTSAILGSDPIELASIGPPQTSPVNLELAGTGNVTPSSEISQTSDSQDHLTNSPPQSSPVNLAQSQTEQ